MWIVGNEQSGGSGTAGRVHGACSRRWVGEDALRWSLSGPPPREATRGRDDERPCRSRRAPLDGRRALVAAINGPRYECVGPDKPSRGERSYEDRGVDSVRMKIPVAATPDGRAILADFAEDRTAHVSTRPHTYVSNVDGRLVTRGSQRYGVLGPSEANRPLREGLRR